MHGVVKLKQPLSIDRGDALNFSDFEYDANASESDEAEETSSECGNAGSEGEFDDSELESDKDQDFFCDFNEEDEDEDEEEEDEEEDDEGQFDVNLIHIASRFKLINLSRMLLIMWEVLTCMICMSSPTSITQMTRVLLFNQRHFTKNS